MEIREIKKILNEYDVEVKKLDFNLLAVKVKLKNSCVRFKLPDDLKCFVNTFIVYDDEIIIYLNKEVLK